MISRILVAAFCMAALSAGPVFAQDLLPEKKADIQAMMELTGSLAMAQQMSDQVMLQIATAIRARNPRIPQRTLDIVREEVSGVVKDNLPSFAERAVGIYHRHFTHEDIKGLLAFYSSELGKKLLRTTPALMLESMRMGAEWGRSLQPEIERRLKKRFQEEGIELAAASITPDV
jgi:uncharacterized protein